MNTFDVKASEAQVSIKPGEERTLTFTVDNTSHDAARAKVWAQAEPAEATDWLQVDELVSFDPSERGRIIEVRLLVPADAKKGAYSFKLGIQNTDTPDEGAHMSPTVNVNVETAGGVPVWVWGLAAAVVLLGVILAVVLAQGGAPECAASGDVCTDNQDCCNELVCRADKTCGPAPVPDAGPEVAPEVQAGPGERCDVNPCAAGLRCVMSQGRKRCRWPNGKACEDDLHCTSGYCDANTGCGRPPPHNQCTNDASCYAGQKCKQVERRLSMCFWEDGQVCANSDECFSQWCYQKRCREPADCSNVKCPLLHKCSPVDGQCRRRIKSAPIKQLDKVKLENNLKKIKINRSTLRRGG